jgi:hypothetical protein
MLQEKKTAIHNIDYSNLIINKIMTHQKDERRAFMLASRLFHDVSLRRAYSSVMAEKVSFS